MLNAIISHRFENWLVFNRNTLDWNAEPFDHQLRFSILARLSTLSQTQSFGLLTAGLHGFLFALSLSLSLSLSLYAPSVACRHDDAWVRARLLFVSAQASKTFARHLQPLKASSRVPSVLQSVLEGWIWARADLLWPLRVANACVVRISGSINSCTSLCPGGLHPSR